MHGLPGVFGALISCIVVAFVSKEKYGESFIKDEFDIKDEFEMAKDDVTPFDASSQAQHQLGCRTSQPRNFLPQNFQPQASNPDIATSLY